MLVSVFTEGNKSKIITTHGTYYSKMSVLDLLDKACIRFASTMEGRMDATRIFMKFPRKTPIVIKPGEIGAFPTMSYKKLECVWFFNHLFEIEELEKGKSRVTFRDGTSTMVHVSKHVLEKQQHRLHFTLETYRNIHQETIPYIDHDSTSIYE